MRLAVLGDPVAHSRSPAIHTAALEALGIPGSYVARRVDADGMAAAVAEIRSGDLDGANVTMPHKQRAARLSDRLDPVAARAGAVNTLVRAADGVAGHLTDVAGIEAAWAEAGLPSEGPVLVLGAGGAAAAALLALEGRPLRVAARTSSRASEMLAAVDVVAEVVPWETAVPGAVVVNATPLGMAGEPLPAGLLDGAAGLFDMAYGGGETPAAARCRAAGLPVADGLDMLLGQAMASFTLWTGVLAPAAAMRTALRG